MIGATRRQGRTVVATETREERKRQSFSFCLSAVRYDGIAQPHDVSWGRQARRLEAKWVAELAAKGAADKKAAIDAA